MESKKFSLLVREKVDYFRDKVEIYNNNFKNSSSYGIPENEAGNSKQTDSKLCSNGIPITLDIRNPTDDEPELFIQDKTLPEIGRDKEKLLKSTKNTKDRDLDTFGNVQEDLEYLRNFLDDKVDDEGNTHVKEYIKRPLNTNNPSVSIDEFQDALPSIEVSPKSSPNKDQGSEVPREEVRPIYVYVSNQPPPPYNDEQLFKYQDGQYVPVNRRNTPEHPRTTHLEEHIQFGSKVVRDKFIRKVYSILTLQLLITFGFIAACIFVKDLKSFMIKQSFTLLLVSCLVVLTVSIAIFCFTKMGKLFPLNFILLIIYTMAMSVAAATFSCLYNTYVVLSAFGATTAICSTISFIACMPCLDITGLGVYWWVAFLVLLLYGAVGLILSLFTNVSTMFLVYGFLVTIFIAFYLLYDTQLILGGKRYEISSEEYILGAISLYTDIITIFMYVLCLCDCKRG